MLESHVKQMLVKTVRKGGGYARRFEDQYAVGMPDLEIIPLDGPIYKVEVKVVKRGKTFGCTERQLEELRRYARLRSSNIVPLLLGVTPGWVLHATTPVLKANIDEIPCRGVGADSVFTVLNTFRLNFATWDF